MATNAAWRRLVLGMGMLTGMAFAVPTFAQEGPGGGHGQGPRGQGNPTAQGEHRPGEGRGQGQAKPAETAKPAEGSGPAILNELCPDCRNKVKTRMAERAKGAGAGKHGAAFEGKKQGGKKAAKANKAGRQQLRGMGGGAQGMQDMRAQLGYGMDPRRMRQFAQNHPQARPFMRNRMAAAQHQGMGQGRPGMMGPRMGQGRGQRADQCDGSCETGIGQGRGQHRPGMMGQRMGQGRGQRADQCDGSCETSVRQQGRGQHRPGMMGQRMGQGRGMRRGPDGPGYGPMFGGRGFGR